MSEALRLFFGNKEHIEQAKRRLSSAAENVENAIIYGTKNPNLWQESKKLFPEISDRIDGVRFVLERRKNLTFTGYDLVINQIIRLTGFSTALANAALINRLYPTSVPLVLDDYQQQRILDEAVKMEIETASDVLEKGRPIDILKEVFDGKLNLFSPNLPVLDQAELGLA